MKNLSAATWKPVAKRNCTVIHADMCICTYVCMHRLSHAVAINIVQRRQSARQKICDFGKVVHNIRISMVVVGTSGQMDYTA